MIKFSLFIFHQELSQLPPTLYVIVSKIALKQASSVEHCQSIVS